MVACASALQPLLFSIVNVICFPFAVPEKSSVDVLEPNVTAKVPEIFVPLRISTIFSVPDRCMLPSTCSTVPA
jgi:hypothetical protein